MVFLFSLINVSFTAFFFFFWQYIESILFWTISILFIVYFSKILSFFIEKKDVLPKDDNPENKEIFFAKFFFKYLKKWAYYISFILFYVSLYGIVYGINQVYGFSYFSELFHGLSICISVIITGIFLLFYRKKQELFFLIFRSNCIAFAGIYSIFFLVFVFDRTSVSPLFVINSIFPLITLFSVLRFDQFLEERDKQIFIYPLFLFYIFLIIGFYASMVFPSVSWWYVCLSVVLFLSGIYTFVFPYIPYLSRFYKVSQTIGVSMAYFISWSLIVSNITNESLSFFYMSAFGISLIYHYSVFISFKNYVSYAIFLFTLLFLYVKTFLFFWNYSFVSCFFFMFLLPYVFVGIGNFISVKTLKKLYILHFTGITFSIMAGVYCFVQGGFDNILSLSVILLFESILLFMSYLQFKK